MCVRFRDWRWESVVDAEAVPSANSLLLSVLRSIAKGLLVGSSPKELSFVMLSLKKKVSTTSRARVPNWKEPTMRMNFCWTALTKLFQR